MKINRIIFVAIILSVLVLSAFGQPTVTLLKRLDDDAGRYGQKLAPIFEDGAGNEAKQNAMEPFVIAYYGWKAKQLTEFGVGQIEAAHLNICRIMLGTYNVEIDGTLKTIIGRAKTPTDWVEVPEAEKKAIHQFVVMKYGGKYMGFDQLFEGKTNPVNQSDKWKYMLGTALGEIGGKIVNWYKFPTSTQYPKSVSESLLGLQKLISEAPAGTSAELLSNLRKLSALGNKTSYNEAERDQVAAALRDALYSTLSFAGLQNSAAAAVPNSAQVSLKQQATDYLEKGKAQAAKGDFKNAVVNFNESIKFNPNDGIAYYHRAKALEELGRIDEAIKDYDSMIAFKIDLQKAYYNRGTLFLEQKKYYLAIVDFNRSLAVAASFNAYYNRGQAHYHTNDFDSAITDFSQAIILNPKDSDAYLNRAYAYCYKGQTGLALKDQEQAIRLGAKDVSKGCQ